MEMSDFSRQDFDDKVMQAVKKVSYITSVETDFERRHHTLDRLEEKGGILFRILGSFLNYAQRSEIDVINQMKEQERIEPYAEEAKKIINQSEIKKILRPKLKTLKESSNQEEIAQAITQTLIPLVLDNTISVSLNPMLFALISLEISKIGVTVFCKPEY